MSIKFTGLVAVLYAILLLACQTKPDDAFEPQPQMVSEQTIETLNIGDKAPDFNLPATDGRRFQLADFASADVLVVIFTSNSCPYTQTYEERMIRFVEDYKSREVALVAIASNSPLAMTPEDLSFTDMDDTYAELQKRADQKKFNFPYLYDGDQHTAGLAYGPQALPHAFVFDEDRTLRYHGNLDFNSKPMAANLEHIRIAVDAILEDRMIIRKERPALGCEVKWSWQQPQAKQKDSTWQAKPVRLYQIDYDSLKTVMVNFSTKALMINFWATWCGPCKQEFPELMQLQRSFGNRNFELVTVSLDDPDKTRDAIDFLKGIHAPTHNFIYTGNKDRITTDLVPGWDGTLPFSIILEPYGEIYKQYTGPIDLLTVRKDIVEHRLLGRYPNLLF